MSRIEAITARALEVPLAKTTAFSTRKLDRRAYLQVEVEAGGRTGTGFCYLGHTGGDVALAAVRQLYAPLLLGGDVLRSQQLWDDAFAQTLLHGRSGTVLRALSALDIAVWDARTQIMEQPLWKAVGGLTDRARAYASGGYYQPTSTPEEISREVEGYRALGFTAVKIKVGREDRFADADRIAAAREVLGQRGVLMLDANNAWRTVRDAAEAVRLWEPYDPYWIEEPFGPDAHEAHRRLAEVTSIPVATGEIEVGLDRFYEMMSRGGVEVIQADAAVCGGITAFLRLVPIAEATGTSICPHWFHELHAHMVGASAAVNWIEYFPTADVLNFHDLLSRRLEVRDGYLMLPDTPGHAIAFDPDALARWSVATWSSRSA
jgi:L-alanine-DL-glutamate epimerase-like enolase superfamily enzyme